MSRKNRKIQFPSKAEYLLTDEAKMARQDARSEIEHFELMLKRDKVLNEWDKYMKSIKKSVKRHNRKRKLLKPWRWIKKFTIKQYKKIITVFKMKSKEVITDDIPRPVEKKEKL